MSKIFAYLRASTDKQDLDQQQLQILDYARTHQLHVDEFVAITISSRKSTKERRIDELQARLSASDTLIVTELSRLGRSTGQIISLIDDLLQQDIRVIVIKQQLMLDRNQSDLQSLTMVTLLSLFAEMERMMISRRTKEALATKKAQGIKLGKPVGTLQESIYDKDRDRIVELLRLGLSVRRIATHHLNYGSPSSLHYYVTTRQLKPD